MRQSASFVTTAHAHDQGFLGVPPAAVYRALEDLPRYGLWWPGIRVDTQGGGTRLDLGAGVSGAARIEGRRTDVGLVVALGPPGSGTLEWYLEPFEEGTIVNSILHLDRPTRGRRGARTLRRARASIRRGLVGLRAHLDDGVAGGAR
jgi:hypothetical protein